MDCYYCPYYPLQCAWRTLFWKTRVSSGVYWTQVNLFMSSALYWHVSRWDLKMLLVMFSVKQKILPLSVMSFWTFTVALEQVCQNFHVNRLMVKLVCECMEISSGVLKTAQLPPEILPMVPNWLGPALVGRFAPLRCPAAPFSHFIFMAVGYFPSLVIIFHQS